jgi:hypothetical protein
VADDCVKQSSRGRARTVGGNETRAENPAFPDLNGKYVGFIVHTKRGYKPSIGTLIASPGDNGSFIHVVASREAFGTPEEALATFETCGGELVRVFKTPTTPGGMMGCGGSGFLDSGIS